MKTSTRLLVEMWLFLGVAITFYMVDLSTIFPLIASIVCYVGHNLCLEIELLNKDK